MPDPTSSAPALDQSFLEMRARCLSLAADLDRLERGPHATVFRADDRLKKLHQAIRILLDGKGNRAEQVQLIFSDKTPIAR